MSIKSTIKSIGRKCLYYPGWQTSRKIIVIESDDWGSLNIPSKEAFHELRSAGIKVDEDPYCKYDGLAEPEDLRKLFQILTSYVDKNGRHPVLTANTVMANPDFAKIRASNFKEYHFEKFTDTLKKNDRTASSFDLWKEGISKNIFVPQFHGREHLQIFDWMNALQAGDEQVHEAFRRGAFGIPTKDNTDRRRNDYRAAFDSNTEQELEGIKKIVKEGLDLFEQLFNYRSYSIIAPCYTWNKRIEAPLYEIGIRLFQGLAFQKEPVLGKNKYKKRYNYLGKKNGNSQYYSVRNVFFEPSLNPNGDSVKGTIQRIKDAFDLNKPAIIGSHRLNYIGSMNTSNRETNLKLFSKVLDAILKRWPDVEFMSTAELAQLITRNKN